MTDLKSQNQAFRPAGGRRRRLGLPASIVAGAAAASLLLSGCSPFANRSLAKPFTPEVAAWRQYLGVAVAVQILALAWAFWSSGRRRKMSRMFLSLLFIPLAWTILGEWAYRLGLWVLGWGMPGKLLAIFLSFVAGTHGIANVYAFFLGASVFNDMNFLFFWALPGIAASYLTALALLMRWPKRRKK